jgi:cytochrome c oxidase assembly factor CtaG
MARRGLIRRSQPLFFAAGIIVLFSALFSIIDTLADQLFLMHMVQHILLMMVAPLLLLLGMPSPLLRWLVQEAKLRNFLDKITHPVTAYLLFTLNLLIWHVPLFYEAALHDELIHDLEHALFFYTGLFYWWRVIDPTHGWYSMWEWQPARWLYIIFAAPPCYILGSILWATNSVFYPFYTEAPRIWGLSALEDQAYGGMIMWLQGWMFLMASMFVFYLRYEPELERV